jgi:phospholipid/cholesterol/gamma-HCH transport system substrate-binding protein
VVVAVVLVALLMFTGGSSYEVTAIFQNGGQLVNGNDVEVGGRPIGSVESIKLTSNGQAAVKMQIDDEGLQPFHEGTTAVIRANSLSGIANRYVSINPGPSNAKKINSGGTILADRTTTPVDLDQLFNTLDPKTRTALQQIIQGSADYYSNRAAQAKAAYQFFNPAISQTTGVMQELTRDSKTLERFIVDSSNVVTGLAERRGELTDLVSNANTTAGAIGDENVALARALDLLPTTLRKANTTFVNLRATLNDLDVLVNASKPATKQLAPFFAALRPLVKDSRPTIQDLRTLIRQPGSNNDLIDLLSKTPRLAQLTDKDFPRAVRALVKANPVIAYLRPYAPELIGFFRDFGEASNAYDANGHYGRIMPIFNAFQFTQTPAGDVLTATPPSQRLAGDELRQDKRCPGAAVQYPPDGSAPFLDQGQLACDTSNEPPGGP